MTPNFSPLVVVTAFFFLVPFALVGASLMTMVASFSESFKEAQTWVSVVLLAPTMLILAGGVVVTWRMRHPRSSLGGVPIVRSESIVSQ